MEDSYRIKTATWQAFQAGDKTAYSIIYRAWYGRLFNYGKKITTDDQLIEDSIQEIFTRFWFHRNKLQSVAALPAYLLVSFRNQLIKAAQKTQNTRYSPGDIHTENFHLELSVDQMMINADHMYEQKVNLAQALEKLTTHQKEAIFLKFYENLSYEEIANLLGISTKATYKLMGRAISELRSAYKIKLASSLLSTVGFIISLF